MDDSKKGRPGGAPPGSALGTERMQQMLADPESRRGIAIRLSVGGGLPGRFEPFEISVDGAGSVTFARTEERGAEQRAQLSMRVDEGVVRDLLQEIDEEDVAGAQRHVPIPPDSLVGLLDIEVGGKTEQVVFMADEEQARTAGFHMAEPLRRLVANMLRIGEEASGAKGSLLAPIVTPNQGD